MLTEIHVLTGAKSAKPLNAESSVNFEWNPAMSSNLNFLLLEESHLLVLWLLYGDLIVCEWQITLHFVLLNMSHHHPKLWKKHSLL